MSKKWSHYLAAGLAALTIGSISKAALANGKPTSMPSPKMKTEDSFKFTTSELRELMRDIEQYANLWREIQREKTEVLQERHRRLHQDLKMRRIPQEKVLIEKITESVIKKELKRRRSGKPEQDVNPFIDLIRQHEQGRGGRGR